MARVWTLARLGSAMLLVGLLGLGLALWREPARSAPITPPSAPHPELAVSRPFLPERAAQTLSARGGDRLLADQEAPDAVPPPSSLVGKLKIGLQVGHWQASEAPPPLNLQTGSTGRGKTEAEVNLPIARAAAAVLIDAGHEVDLLSTLMSRGYAADLVVAIHADGGPSSRRGFFVDTSFRQATAADEARLARAITDAYKSVGIPNVFRGTPASKYYYGYYRADASTPMVLIETGFLTNAEDQKVIVDNPTLAGRAIATGILEYASSLAR